MHITRGYLIFTILLQQITKLLLNRMMCVVCVGFIAITMCCIFNTISIKKGSETYFFFFFFNAINILLQFVLVII